MEVKRKFAPSNLKTSTVILASVFFVLFGQQNISESAPLKKSIDKNPNNAIVAAFSDDGTPAENAQTSERTRVNISWPN